MSKDLAVTKADKYNGIKQLLINNEKAIIDIIPDNVDVKRMIGGILMQTRVNPALLDCSGESILVCGLTAFSLGLETTPALHQVAMVPFSRSVKVGNQWKKIKEAQLMIEYRGLIVLALRSGEVAVIDAYLVYESEVQNGLFTLEYGLTPNITHKPDLMLPPSKRGGIVGVYAVASFRDGTKKFHYMWMEEVIKRRNNSKAYQYDIKNKKIDSPWIAWEEEMVKKTAIKGLARTLQLSPIKSQFNRAISLDDMTLAGKSQIPHLSKEIEALDLDIPGEFNESPPEEEAATLEESDFGKATEEDKPREEKPATTKTSTANAQTSATKEKQNAEEKKSETKKTEPKKEAGKSKADDARKRVLELVKQDGLHKEIMSILSRARDEKKIMFGSVTGLLSSQFLSDKGACPDKYILSMDQILGEAGIYQ